MNRYTLRGRLARVLLLGALFAALPARAHAYAAPLHPAPAADTTALKYWIFLTDKAGPGGHVAAPAAGYVTEAAQLRRARRGSTIPAGLDAPLSTAYLDRLAELGVTPLVASRWLNAVSARLAPAQLRAVGRLPFVRAVRPVGTADPARTTEVHDTAEAPAPLPLVYAAGSGAGPAVGRSYRLDYGLSEHQLAMINAIAPLERGINGSGVRLGFLDTEYGAFTHPAFALLLQEGRLLGTENFAQSSQNDRHGMNVASVAVGYAPGDLIGPAYGASVWAATTEYAPSETNQEEDNFVAGLEWLERQGVDVINTSLGYTTFDPGERSYTPADLDGDTGVTTIAADRAVGLGIVFVASAGNEGCTTPDQCWYYIGTPADGDSVIAVAAVRPDSVRASFSSSGPTADGRIKPDVAALGASVYVPARNTTRPGVRIAAGSYYSSGSGTSFASPIVAAVACQILQANPGLTPMEVRDLLRETASQAGSPDHALGWGIINADAAVRGAERLLAHAEQPEAFRFVQPYPNPFATTATFEVTPPAPIAHARLAVVDLLGRTVAVLHEGALAAGFQAISFDGRNLSPGVYFFVFEGDGHHETGKIVLAR